MKKLGRIERVGQRVTGNRCGGKRGIGWEVLQVAVYVASRLPMHASQRQG
jgi:hypothetical protein